MQTPLCRYVWKLLYIYMLGYDVEFGHMEARGPSDTASRSLFTHSGTGSGAHLLAKVRREAGGLHGHQRAAE